jgi:hypothetical protein
VLEKQKIEKSRKGQNAQSIDWASTWLQSNHGNRKILVSGADPSRVSVMPNYNDLASL